MPGDAFDALRAGALCALECDHVLAERRRAWPGAFDALVASLLAESRAALGVYGGSAAAEKLWRETIRRLEHYKRTHRTYLHTCRAHLVDLRNRCMYTWGAFPFEWVWRAEDYLREFDEIYPWVAGSDE